jgi:hypothetical protein
MDHMNQARTCLLVLLLLAIASSAVPAFAQADFAGVWASINNEDKEPRDPLPGEYAGIPLNEAGKMRASTWSAAIWQLPEWQCRPHPINYWARSPHAILIQPEINPYTREVGAFRVQMGESIETLVYMDGRPHPAENALHTWNGFSTGEWIGDTLKFTTTHLKESYIRRNGVEFSDQTTITEYWMRRGDILTWVQITKDPVYLTEPFVRISEFRYNPRGFLETDQCVTVQEGDYKRGEVPRFFPGENDTLKLYSEQFESPFEANMGGAETMYPEYREKLRALGGVRIPTKPFDPR